MKNYTFSISLSFLFWVMLNSVVFAQTTNPTPPKFAPEGGIMVYFNSGNATLDAASKKTIDAVLNGIKDGEKISVKVYGHTDSFGSDEPNIALSRKRCYAVWDYVMAKKMYDIKSGDVSMNGEYIPTVDNENEQHRAKNRRVYLVVTKL